MNKFKNFGLYKDTLNKILHDLKVTDQKNYSLNIDNSLDKLKKIISKNQVFLIGNGGSSSNCDHISNDFSKILGSKSINLYGTGIFTCFGNDYGYNNVFSKQIELLGKKNDTLICLSCSGESKNLLNAVKIAKKKNIRIVTLTGLSPSNSLRKKGSINFYINSKSYGLIEIAHLTILHYLVEN